jgi:L-ascorbate metabolism protein UlaG (beta-lactamase superfamily)
MKIKWFGQSCFMITSENGTNVDILLLPIGGLATINAANAVQVAKQLNPTIIIPNALPDKGIRAIRLYLW